MVKYKILLENNYNDILKIYIKMLKIHIIIDIITIQCNI